MQSSYPDQDHTFGQVVLTLRSALGLTQAGLADILGVSRRSIGDWEASTKFPEIINLRAFIRLAFEGGAFRPGH